MPVPKRPPWSLKESVIVGIIVFAITNLVAIFVLLQSQEINLKVYFFSIFIQTITIIFGIEIVLARHKIGFRYLGLKDKKWLSHLSKGFLWGIIIFILVTLTNALLMTFLPYEPPPQDLVVIALDEINNPRSLLLLFILASFLAPLGEELYFRGFLYPAIAKHTGNIAGMLITSIVFGALHLSWPQFLPLTLGGLFLNWLYFKEGSLYTAIAAHSMWNALAIIILALVPRLI